MCLTCGCGDPYDQHGDSRYLVFDDLAKSCEPDKMSAEEALKNLNETIKKVPAEELTKKRGV
jgi:hypothetical protein